MSFGGFLKKVGKGIGKVTSIASPLLMATGVGAPLAIGLGAAGSLASGHNLKDTAFDAVKNFALGSAGKAVIGGVKGLGLLGKGDMAAAGATPVSSAPQVIGGSSILSRLGGGLETLLGGKTAAGGAGGVDWGSIIGNLGKVGLGAAGAITASNQQGKADALRDKALKLTEDQYAAGAPLRQLGMAGLTDPRVHDLTSVFQAPATNYRRISA